jgi:dTDP-4-dehydrorhamnose reductase
VFLLVGGDSEIGAAAYRQLLSAGRGVLATTRRAQLISPDRPQLDLADDLSGGSGWQPPPNVSAACILAAHARLAACAADPEATARINITQTLVLIERLLARGIYVLFLSTNQVFDGTVAHVDAAAPTCPVSEYGRQKALTEAHLREKISRGAAIGILRFAKVVSPGMALLVDWAKALTKGDRIRAFHDMHMAPIPVAQASAAIAGLMDARAAGTFQLTGTQDVTYTEVAQHIAGRVGADPALIDAVAARSTGLPEGATPRHTTLDSRAIRDRLGIAPPGPWEVVDAACL